MATVVMIFAVYTVSLLLCSTLLTISQGHECLNVQLQSQEAAGSQLCLGMAHVGLMARERMLFCVLMVWGKMTAIALIERLNSQVYIIGKGGRGHLTVPVPAIIHSI